MPCTFVYVPMGQTKHCVSRVALPHRRSEGGGVSLGSSHAGCSTAGTHPSVCEYFPGGQGTQAVPSEPSGRYVPSGHGRPAAMPV